LYAQKLLPTEAFAQSSFYTQKFLHIERSIYTEKLLHTEASTLHTEAFTHRSFYAQKLLHREAIYTEQLCTQKLFQYTNASSIYCLHGFRDAKTKPEIIQYKADEGPKYVAN